MGEMKVKIENEIKEMRENRQYFGQSWSFLGITILYSGKWLEITIQRSSKSTTKV